MRNKILIILQVIFLSLVLTSCGTKTYPVEAYKKELKYHEDYKILQFTDIHFGLNVDIDYEFNYLNKVLKEAGDVDLIVITGDSFLFGNKTMVKSLLKFFDSLNIPWTYTFGNHDNQGYYDHGYINRQLMKCKNIVYVDYEDDDIDGFTNFYINLLDESNNTKYRLYVVDSNSYHYTGPDYDYDIIHPNQLEHLKNIDNYENDNAPGIMLIHIPIIEVDDAYNGYKEGLYEGKGEHNEPYCPGYMNNGAYDVFKSIGIIGVFYGHDHINYTTINYKNEMILSYGIKATDLVYYDKEIQGCQIITLPNDPSEFGVDNVKWVIVPYES